MADTDSTPGNQTIPMSAQEYWDHYAHDFYEWRNGEASKLPVVTQDHQEAWIFIRTLIDAYFIIRPVGTTIMSPFLMHLVATESFWEPDIQVILKTNPIQLTACEMPGPADIVVEIVTLDSIERDYGTKFVEYEKGGVKEYWLIDPLRRIAHFFRLNIEGLYQLFTPDIDGHYETPALPGLKIHVPTLWNKPLPHIVQTMDMVKAMLVDE
jgi:Uma2 family endonuclease